MWDAIWVDARLATMAESDGLGAIERGAVAVAGEDLAWVGAAADLPDRPERLAHVVHRAEGRWITPGLVDCHTHLIFAGDRIGEFEQQIAGATRAELAATGGGIVATMRATRGAGEAELQAGAQRRLMHLMAQGVTTIEIKSGYGLDAESELRMLRAARALGRANPVTVVTSFLGAHALPPEYSGRAADYIDHLCTTVLPQAVAEGLVDICDGGVESLAFSHDDMDRLFAAAQQLGVPIRAHADQYRNVGGAAFLAERGALSADHLEYAGEDGIRAMAAAGTAAVLLPGSTFFLREARMPPVASFRAHGVPMALATNCNPGSSPVLSPLLVMAMACTMFRLTPTETLRGFTANAARALGRADKVGTLAAGMQADLAVWDIGTPAELSYWLGGINPCRQVVQRGQVVRGALD